MAMAITVMAIASIRAITPLPESIIADITTTPTTGIAITRTRTHTAGIKGIGTTRSDTVNPTLRTAAITVRRTDTTAALRTMAVGTRHGDIRIVLTHRRSADTRSISIGDKKKESPTALDVMARQARSLRRPPSS